MRRPSFRAHSYANVTSTVALVLALTGGAFAAAALPAGSVGTKQLKSNAVTSAKIKDGTIKKADLAAGQVLAWRGAWSGATAYKPQDVVAHEGASYVAGAAVTGTAPPAAPWVEMAAQGLPGDAGAAGPQGPQGPQGPSGPTGPQGPSGVVSVVTNSGNSTTPTTTQAFVSPTVQVNIPASGHVLDWTATATLGTAASAASDLNLYPCYRLTSAPSPTLVGQGAFGMRLPANTRVPFTLSGSVNSLAAGTYLVGLCAASINANWTSNEFGYVTATLSKS